MSSHTSSGKIALLVWGLKGGSLANYAAALLRGFWDNGERDLYVFYIAEGPGSHIQIPEGVTLIPLGAKRSRWMPLALAKRLREVQPDYLISISAFINFPAILGWLLAGKGSAKLIVSQHSTMSYKAYVEHTRDLKVRLQPWLARLMYPLATGLHANSEAVLADLLETVRVPMPVHRTIATPNPVNLSAIQTYSRQAPNHPWLIDKDLPVILSVGRLAQQKNFPKLLAAFAQVRRQQPCRLIILGEGPERSALEQAITKAKLQDWVSLPGFTPNPWCCMAAADVFVLSSEEEPFGLVLVEAMAAGTPIVATDALGGGPKSVLAGGQYGRLVPPDDTEALAHALLEVLQSPQERAQLVADGYQRCAAFQPTVIAQQWLAFLRQLSSTGQEGASRSTAASQLGRSP